MIVYLSGPMRGLPLLNWPAFIDGAARLRAAGFEVLSPAEHAMDAGFDPRLMPQPPGGWNVRRALRWDCEAVLRSDLVAVLPGWQDSRGALAEVALACAAEIPVEREEDVLAGVSPGDIRVTAVEGKGTWYSMRTIVVD
jgi:hypothetical protein